MTHNFRLCLALFAAGASCFGACSDSGFSAAPTNGGSAGGPAGQAGEEPMSSSGSGSGATANTGGSDAGAGQPAGGAEPMSGGEAGMSSMEPTVGTTCLACPVDDPGGATDQKGCAALKSCDASPTCKPWASCVRACEDDNCVSACDASHPEVARYRQVVYACLCQTCASVCAPIGVCDRQCDSSKDLEPVTVAPDNLAQTLLYATDTEVAPYARSYQPEYPLWSDGALKDRFIYVPACSRIDTTDMDHWSFPVGTRLWKHFRIPSSNGQDIVPKLVETRFIHRFGPGADDWVFAAYQWPVDLGAGTVQNPTLAKLVPNGVVNANGTTHDIPSVPQCKNCHTKLQERVLSFGAFQLSHQLAGETITTISNDGWLTVPAPQGFQPPGSEIAQAALGYLHANCGNCHNAAFRPVEPPPLMKLLVTQTALDQTDTVTSLFNVPTQNVDFVGLDRIEPGSSDKSEIVVRMQRRPPQTGQMPPLATKVVHPDGVAAISAWINGLDPSGF